MALIDRLLGRPTPEEVVRAHGPTVMRHLRRVFGPRADIDDVFQAVFVEIIRSLPRFRGASELKTWLHRITMNVAYQEMRLQYRSRASLSIDEIPEPVAEGDLEADLADQQALQLMYAGLETLDAKKRIAVILHDIEGLPLREISEQVGRPLQTVASQLKAGRAELALWIAGRRSDSTAGRAKEAGS
ncbi:MAG: RNA polymerase sigma factor [Deltaproteobacteria bacterium]|nr:RNA polymerase sigma factor [Deltaproteobacteria bacterium]